MKPVISFLVALLIYLPFNLAAQQAPSKWRWGVGVGINSLYIPKGGGNINLLFAQDNKEATITRVGNRFGFQINSLGCYQFNKRWSLIGGLGITKAESKAYRKINHDGYFLFLSSNYISWDTIVLKYLLLDLRLNIRFQITTFDPSYSNINLFIDLGTIGEFPLVNHSSYSYNVDYSDFYYTHGKLSLEPLTPYIALGLIGKHFDGSLGFSLLTNKNTKDDHSYNTLLTRFTINRYF